MPVSDRLARPLRQLRVSVTDKCNLRCAYCMPEAEYQWLPGAQVLSVPEVVQLVRAFVALGVDRVRLTGGEPLVRAELPELVRALVALPGLREVSLTTNGVLLEGQAAELKAAGLHRVTVSLDTLRADRFAQLTRRETHGAVLKGLEAARRVGFAGPLKIDTVVMRGVNDDELDALLAYAASLGAQLRFIEYMDVGGATKWSPGAVVSQAELLQRLGPVTPVPGPASAPARVYQLASGQQFGVIASTTQPFCGQCDRARLTADGTLFTCLYATRGVGLREPLRAGASVLQLQQLISEAWQARNDRGAEERRALQSRGPLKNASELKAEPLLEMHVRGG